MSQGAKGPTMRGPLWPQMSRSPIAAALSILLLISYNVGSLVAAADPYIYSSPPPPPSYEYKSPPPPPPSPSPPPPYYYKCYDWAYPKKSHDKKHLKGAVVEVTCEVGSKTIKAYGTTKINGKYSIIVKDLDYAKYESAAAAVCKAKLHAPPKDSPCNIPTLLNEGTHLFVKSKDKYELVLKAHPFAYAPKKPYQECEKHTHHHHHHNHNPSPTPPSSGYWV
ncbi:hypothetical protein PIB30_003368 [Stylosanthes scabra]|uniref:Uncharacterized protein n=1 Tax=Stylosanthes scabra TaxID=79078 RepID=A0ABU6T415_9FABA|nr:hypothetical protein [Stylosanthes scabra]